MEYCLGSTSDIIEVHKSPLLEEEISAICSGTKYSHMYILLFLDILDFIKNFLFKGFVHALNQDGL